MYGLPSDTDISGFIGQDLRVINLGKRQVGLSFTMQPECWVTIEGDYSVAIGGREATRFDSATAGAAHLAELLTKPVASAVVVNDALRLTFDDDSVVEVHDSESSYESYQFTVDGSTFIV